ncbi:MAG: hypothetical protein ISQ85_06895 [Planktomarina sp.]|nr:hypothetical protein [Planktomarina sp.]
MIDDKKNNYSAKIVGSSLSGVFEIGLFHPVDTITKRLMYNKQIIKGSNFSEKKSNLNKILFKENYNLSFFSKYKSLYNGVNYALAYKILQRTYKYGGQSILNEKLKKNIKTDNKVLIQSVSGAMIGAGEVFLLPLDILKIKMQTNPNLLKDRSVFDIVKKERMNLYKGTGMTIMRNVPGSFALFGGNSLSKEYLFNLTDYSKATFFQNFISSTLGAFCSITVSSPMDVIKTRIQADNNNYSSRQIVIDLIKKEGISSFFKGLGPKIMIVGPKLVFSFTVAQQLISYFQDKI